MKMLMDGANATGLESYFYQHQLLIICNDLSLYALACPFPGYLAVFDKYLLLSGHLHSCFNSAL